MPACSLVVRAAPSQCILTCVPVFLPVWWMNGKVGWMHAEDLIFPNTKPPSLHRCAPRGFVPAHGRCPNPGWEMRWEGVTVGVIRL